MTHNRLTIVSTDNTPSSPEKSPSSSRLRRHEFQAHFDKAWHRHPEQFDPQRNSMERERLERTQKLVLRHMDLQGKTIADLGCGSGVLTRMLRSKDTLADAVDISEVALKELQKADDTGIHPIQDFVPATKLKDDHYDLVVSTELIGYLPEELFRLYFSELARVVKPEGLVVCSTAVDIHSDDSLERFHSLAGTEFEPLEWLFSYHRLTLQLLNFFKASLHFVQAAQDPECRHSELKKRTGTGRWWFSVNSSPAGSLPWRIIQYLFYPIVYLLSQHRTTLIVLEKICRIIYGDSGISHALFIGKRKRVFQPLQNASPPVEMKHKKQVWE